jgi:hypothetical protein
MLQYFVLTSIIPSFLLSPIGLVSDKENYAHVSPPTQDVSVDERKSEDEWVNHVFKEKYPWKFHAHEADEQENAQELLGPGHFVFRHNTTTSFEIKKHYDKYI